MISSRIKERTGQVCLSSFRGTFGLLVLDLGACLLHRSEIFFALVIMASVTAS